MFDACEREPIVWSDAERVSRDQAMRTLALDSLGRPTPSPLSVPLALEMCEGSAVYTRVTGAGDAFAAWWRARRDSTVELVSQ